MCHALDAEACKEVVSVAAVLSRHATLLTAGALRDETENGFEGD